MCYKFKVEGYSIRRHYIYEEYETLKIKETCGGFPMKSKEQIYMIMKLRYT